MPATATHSATIVKSGEGVKALASRAAEPTNSEMTG